MLEGEKMDAEELIKQAERIKSNSETSPMETFSEALEFFRVYAGEKSAFYIDLKSKIKLTGSGDPYFGRKAASSLDAFINFVKSGLMEDISIERKAQIDVVSDLLGQAHELINSKGVHPAAPTVIIGASLEEFLRNWVEESDLKLKTRKPSLDAYANVLREADLITKQDMKDITSWGGLRNHAAHGEWDEVDDKKRVSLMLDGVNLFMRKYGEK